MTYTALCFAFLFCSLLGTGNLEGEEHLKKEDVVKVMQQIFDQHVDQKNISEKILKNAFIVYINQFDPDRTYLLAREIAFYENLPEDQIKTIMRQYKANDFQSFAKLNAIIQKAIYRARTLREKIEKDPAHLFSDTFNENKLANEANPPFAASLSTLQERIQNRIVQFIEREKRRFGQAAIMKNQQQTLSLFEKQLREKENRYLYLNQDGQQLTAEQQESLFVMHILKALAGSLDSHTSFYTESEAYDVKLRLEKGFQGIGIIMQQNPDNSVSITGLTAGGPAEKNGLIHVGDTLLEVNGKKVTDLPLNSIIELIRFASPLDVRLKVMRKADKEKNQSEKIIEVSLKKETIALQGSRVDVSYEKFDDGVIGVITLHSFYQNSNGINSESDVRQAIKKLTEFGPLKGLILDLRENSGGFLNQAVNVAGLFITNGIVVIAKYFNNEERFYRDIDGKTVYDGPLIVLTSRATASAAEIVAQALQDYGVALVVGDEQTYGKGTVQSQTLTEDKAASYFKVTVGRYYTVSGKTPQIEGVKPDVVAPGIFSYEKIGEKYLSSTIDPDRIPEDYNDNLTGINPDLKEWFLRYYIPTLQHKKQLWSSILPTLKKNSKQRILQDKGYQTFLKRLQGIEDSNGNDNAERKDFQLAEALNILKDMISLEAENQHEPSIANGSTENK